MNLVVLQGNVTRDGEVRHFANGGQVTSFGVAVNERYKQNDEWKDKTTFIDCKYFGTATVEKGDAVVLNGQIDVESWETENGKRSKQLVKVTHIKKFSGYKGNNTAVKQTVAEQEPELVAVGGGEDVPF